jgi:hypothetical protein
LQIFPHCAVPASTFFDHEGQEEHEGWESLRTRLLLLLHFMSFMIFMVSHPLTCSQTKKRGIVLGQKTGSGNENLNRSSGLQLGLGYGQQRSDLKKPVILSEVEGSPISFRHLSRRS